MPKLYPNGKTGFDIIFSLICFLEMKSVIS